MSRLRVLVLGSDCNPEGISVPFVGYCHAAALAQYNDVTLVTRAPMEATLRRAGAPFRGFEIVRMPLLERVFAWVMKNIFKGNFDTQLLTVFYYPFALAFEWFAWRQLRPRILAGEFDVVMRVLPITTVLPSPFAFFLRNGPIPFVVGPVNGGLPWPPGFEQLERQKEWVSHLRNLYRHMPFARSTYRHAAAIMAASSQTYAELATYRDKMFFVPENGISSLLCSRPPAEPNAKLQLIFVGGLVPRKACDLALRGAAPLLQKDLAQFTILGDGPERGRLEELAKSLGIEKAVSFLGWRSHSEVLTWLRTSDVLVFPSVRDFGGGVVFEALAVGAVPVVVDFGGPGDIVRPEVGYKVPLTNEREVTSTIETILNDLATKPELLNRLREQGMSYARETLTWDVKAQTATQVLQWVVGQGGKPSLPPPKILFQLANPELG